jgi:hypothetical protein
VGAEKPQDRAKFRQQTPSDERGATPDPGSISNGGLACREKCRAHPNVACSLALKIRATTRGQLVDCVPVVHVRLSSGLEI